MAIPVRHEDASSRVSMAALRPAESLGSGSRPTIGSTAITWNREISSLVYDRCASCHRPGGSAFSLMTYADVQPRGNAIKDAVLARRMPPWGAVKGFGNFRNDQSLTQEQIELITKWVDGGIRRGNNPRMLPEFPFSNRPLHRRFRSIRSGSRAQPRCARTSCSTEWSPNACRRGVRFRSSRRCPGAPWSRWSGCTTTTSRFPHPFLFRRAAASSGRDGDTRGVPADAVVSPDVAASRAVVAPVSDKYFRKSSDAGPRASPMIQATVCSCL